METKKGVEFRNISKEFFGKYVLEDINLFFAENKIHAIVGENGAGKSTLMNILSGVYMPASGQIFIDGEDARIRSPKDAEQRRIGMVYQHFMLVDTLNVWQNVILGGEPKKNFTIDKKAALAHIDETCEKYGIVIEKNTPVGLLPVGEQQRVEILKVLYRDAKYIVFDEPTSVLTPAETEKFLESLTRLREMGKTIFFISHKLEEVGSAADTITVLRDGRSYGMVDAAGAKMDDIVRKMVGRDIDLGRRIKNEKTGGDMLVVKNISTERRAFNCRLDSLSLSVREGEILGVAGVDGNGQQELVDALLGMEKPSAGNITLNGRDITGFSTPSLRKSRIACIPPDRQEQGLVLAQSIVRNAALGCEDRAEFKTGPFLSPKKIRAAVSVLIDGYNVKYNNLDQQMRGLSGGNQQKLIFARECEWKGKELILAVNPTRGLDIGAIEFVYHKLNQYKLEGKAVLLISTELSEIVTLADRIAVLYRGKVVRTVENEQVDIEEIGAYMAGVRQ